MIHLQECEPEKNPDWIRVTFFAAHRGGAEYPNLCPAVEYMRDELFPDESVWIGGEHEST